MAVLRQSASACHGARPELPADAAPVVLVGNPNVGKSVLFGALTGRYVVVSNYPGTTVEIARGSLKINESSQIVIDTPGVHSLVPTSDDERVTRDILLDAERACVVDVMDTKNLQRGLLVALELAEAGLPMVVCLNMADEAEARGVRVDAGKLSAALGVPVVSTVACKGTGVPELAHRLAEARPSTHRVTYAPAIEDAIRRLMPHLPGCPGSPECPGDPGDAPRARAAALTLLAGDEQLPARMEMLLDEEIVVNQIRRETQAALGEPLAYAINRRRLEVASIIAAEVTQVAAGKRSIAQALAHWTSHPLVGWPILAGILYLIYLFVGVLGAGTLVDFLEETLFGHYLNPWATNLVEVLLPWRLGRDFLIGEYGLITMGLTYGLAIVLPIVTTFFLAFSILEDTGYLPRLAVMLDRAFRLMGLNGKAVLPMVLGLGCVTMATMTTRILESRKERLLVTLLLALGVPCSAQLGVILGMISGLGAAAILTWVGVVSATVLAVGFLSARLLGGAGSDFILELPPMRRPSLRNIALKTVARVEWYLKEVVPVFVIGTAALFVMDKIGLLTLVERALSPLIVYWLGLPTEVTGALVVGFLRRDYGAAGLFALSREGALSPEQVLVSLVVITLFMPCIASLLVIVREYGAKTATAVAAFVFPFAFVVGGVLHWTLHALGAFAS